MYPIYLYLQGKLVPNRKIVLLANARGPRKYEFRFHKNKKIGIFLSKFGFSRKKNPSGLNFNKTFISSFQEFSNGQNNEDIRSEDLFLATEKKTLGRAENVISSTLNDGIIQGYKTINSLPPPFSQRERKREREKERERERERGR